MKGYVLEWVGDGKSISWTDFICHFDVGLMVEAHEEVSLPDDTTCQSVTTGPLRHDGESWTLGGAKLRIGAYSKVVLHIGVPSWADAYRGGNDRRVVADDQGTLWVPSTYCKTPYITDWKALYGTRGTTTGAMFDVGRLVITPDGKAAG